MPKLSPKHLKVVNEYMKGRTKSDALRLAGFSEHTCKHETRQVFGREDVKNEIDRRSRNMVERAKVTEDWIIERLKRVADSSVGDLIELDGEGQPYFDWKKLTPDLKKALSDLDIHEYKEGRGPSARDVKKIKVAVQPQMKALELLGKYLGMWKEKVEVTGEDALINGLFEGRKRANKRNDSDSSYDSDTE